MSKTWFYKIIFELNRWSGVKLGWGYAGKVTLNAEARAAASLLGDGQNTILDIGANEGNWSRELLALAPQKVGKIYAFEPMPTHHEKIRSVDNMLVELIPKAVGSESGETPIFSHIEGASISSVYQRELRHYGIEFTEQARVPITTVDAFLDEMGIDEVDFMKMDIEGHELAALKGARNALEQGRIKALSFEMGGCNIDSRTYFRDFWLYLSPLGFKIYRINPTDGLHLIDKYHESHENFMTTNFIATSSNQSPQNTKWHL